MRHTAAARRLSHVAVLRAEYTGIRAGVRCCAVSSEHRVSTTDRNAVNAVEYSGVHRSACLSSAGWDARIRTQRLGPRAVGRAPRERRRACARKPATRLSAPHSRREARCGPLRRGAGATRRPTARARRRLLTRGSRVCRKQEGGTARCAPAALRLRDAAKGEVQDGWRGVRVPCACTHGRSVEGRRNAPKSAAKRTKRPRTKASRARRAAAVTPRESGTSLYFAPPRRSPLARVRLSPRRAAS